MDRLIGRSAPPVSQLPPGNPPVQATASTPALPPSSDQVLDERAKSKKHRAKPDSAKANARAARKKRIDEIKQCARFDDCERYGAAVKTSSANLLDLAALIIRMAQDKFQLEDGLSPTEVAWLLDKRFFIKVEGRALRRAMQEAPADFFSAAPADFDDRAKLYRPVMGCIDRVNCLLDAHKELQRSNGEGVQRVPESA